MRDAAALRTPPARGTALHGAARRRWRNGDAVRCRAGECCPTRRSVRGGARRGAGRAVRGSEARGRRPRHVVPPRLGVGRLRAGRGLRALLGRGREQAAGPRGRRAAPGGLRRRSPRARRAAGLAAAAARRLLPAGPGLDRAARGQRRLLGQQLGSVRAAARGAARGRAGGEEGAGAASGGGVRRGRRRRSGALCALRSELFADAARPGRRLLRGGGAGPGALKAAPRCRNPADILEAQRGAARPRRASEPRAVRPAAPGAVLRWAVPGWGLRIHLAVAVAKFIGFVSPL